MAIEGLSYAARKTPMSLRKRIVWSRHCLHKYTVFTVSTETPYLFTIFVLKFELVYSFFFFFFFFFFFCCMYGSIDAGQMPCSAASDLVLHCLQRSFCFNT